MSILDGANDVDLLDNLEAASLDDPKPKQENPFSDVPEDQLRDLNALEVAMPAMEALVAKLPIISKAREDIESSGKISQSQAERISVDVPQIFGTQEDPVAYSTAPTGAGVKQAVAILSEEENSLIATVKKSTKEIIEKKLIEAEKDLKSVQDNFLEVSSQYLKVQQTFLEATTESVTNSIKVFVGDVSLYDVLTKGHKLNGDTKALAESSASLKKYLDRLIEITGVTASNFDNLFNDTGREPFIHIGSNNCYHLSDLVEGDVETEEFCPAVPSTLLSLITIPTDKLDPEEYEGYASVFAAVTASVKTLIGKLSEEEAELDSVESNQKLTELISKISLTIAIIDQLLVSSQRAVEVVKAGNDFCMDLISQAPAQVGVAAESIGSPLPLPAKGSVFSRRAKLLS